MTTEQFLKAVALNKKITSLKDFMFQIKQNGFSELNFTTKGGAQLFPPSKEGSFIREILEIHKQAILLDIEEKIKSYTHEIEKI